MIVMVVMKPKQNDGNKDKVMVAINSKKIDRNKP